MQPDGFLHPQGYGHDEVLPGGGGAPCVLWQWNGVDTTQFAAAPLLPIDSGGFTITGAPALSIAVGDEGNRLRLVTTGVNQRGALIWPVAAAEGLVLPFRYIVRFSTFVGTPVPSSHFVGVYYYCDGEVALGVSHGITFLVRLTGAQTSAGIETDGTYAFTAALAFGVAQPKVIELEIRGQKTGNDPGAVVSSLQAGSANAIAGTCQELNDATYFTGFPASWDALTEAQLSQFGIAIHLTAAGTNPAVEFGMIEVLSHPLDWT
jgi:hypothetical protein